MTRLLSSSALAVSSLLLGAPNVCRQLYVFLGFFFLKSRILHTSYVPSATLIHKQRSEPGKQHLHRTDWRATGWKNPPLSVPSTLRYNTSLAMFDIYRLPYIIAIMFLFPATSAACSACKCCVCTALKDPTVIFHSNVTAKSLPFSTCMLRQTSQFSSLWHLHDCERRFPRSSSLLHHISGEPVQVRHLPIFRLN